MAVVATQSDAGRALQRRPLHGTKWLPDDAPGRTRARLRQPAPPGIVIHCGSIADDEICLRQSIDCTTPARTAYDIGRRTDRRQRDHPDRRAAQRHPLHRRRSRAHRRPVPRCARHAPASRRRWISPTVARNRRRRPELRLLLVRDGLPRPVTQIHAYGHNARRIDMGWPAWKVGVEYDGEQHCDRSRRLCRRHRTAGIPCRTGWIIVRVSARQLRYDRAGILRRVRRAVT